MTSYATLKYKCNRYLFSCCYNNLAQPKERIEAINSNYKKYEKLVDEIKIIKKIKLYINKRLLFGNEPTKCYINLHFLKMLEHYIYIRFYHNNIQKQSRNERLLCYLESKIECKGFDPREWDRQYKIVGADRIGIGMNQELFYYYINKFLFV